jgi:hypothetical protein
MKLIGMTTFMGRYSAPAEAEAPAEDAPAAE